MGLHNSNGAARNANAEAMGSNPAEVFKSFSGLFAIT